MDMRPTVTPPAQRTTLLCVGLLVTIIVTVLVGLIAMHSMRSEALELSAPVGVATTALHPADCDQCDPSHPEASCADALTTQPASVARSVSPKFATPPSTLKQLPRTLAAQASSPPSLTELSISRT